MKRIKRQVFVGRGVLLPRDSTIPRGLQWLGKSWPSDDLRSDPRVRHSPDFQRKFWMLVDAAREWPVYKRSLRNGEWIASGQRTGTEDVARAELDRIFKLLKGRRHDPRRPDPLTILQRSEAIFDAVEEKRNGGARKERWAAQDVADESDGKLTLRHVRSARQYVRAHRRAVAKLSDKKIPAKPRKK